MKTKPADPNNLLDDVSSRYGAPMGRRSIHDAPSATVTLFRVRFYDGDYDRGGAYWGGGGSPLFAAIGDDFQHFLRAEGIRQAEAQLLKQFPKLVINRASSPRNPQSDPRRWALPTVEDLHNPL